MAKSSVCEHCGEFLGEHVSRVVPGLVIRTCINAECSKSSHYIGLKAPTAKPEVSAEPTKTVFDKIQNQNTHSITVRPPENSIRLEKNFPLAELPTLTSEQLLASLQGAQLFIQENSIAGCSDAELGYWLKYTDECRKLVLDLVERRRLKITHEQKGAFIEQRQATYARKNTKLHKKTQKSVEKAAKTSFTPEHQKLIKQASMFGVDDPGQYKNMNDLREALKRKMAE